MLGDVQPFPARLSVLAESLLPLRHRTTYTLETVPAADAFDSEATSILQLMSMFVTVFILHFN